MAMHSRLGIRFHNNSCTILSDSWIMERSFPSLSEMADQVGHDIVNTMGRKGYIYFVTNKYNRVLYTGVTNSLVRRSAEHGEHRGSVFTEKYNCGKLVYYEVFPDIEQAIVREKQLKHFKREWKDQLVNAVNPEWRDLNEGMVADPDEMPGRGRA